MRLVELLGGFRVQRIVCKQVAFPPPNLLVSSLCAGGGIWAEKVGSFATGGKLGGGCCGSTS